MEICQAFVWVKIRKVPSTILSVVILVRNCNITTTPGKYPLSHWNQILITSNRLQAQSSTNKYVDSSTPYSKCTATQLLPSSAQLKRSSPAYPTTTHASGVSFQAQGSPLFVGVVSEYGKGGRRRVTWETSPYSCPTDVCVSVCSRL